MKIENDLIEFEVADIAQFSPALQDDLQFRAGVTPSHEYLSARVNAVLEEATVVHDKDRLEQVKDVCLVYAKADSATQDVVKTALGIAIVAPA